MWKKFRPIAVFIWRLIKYPLRVIKRRLIATETARKIRNYKRAKRVAFLDRYLATSHIHQFRRGNRPVIRWIKGDGLDDEVTRAAIAQATRLFGEEVDYCLITQGISPARARDVLAWADQSVEWWPITEKDNLELAQLLHEAGCPTEDFGFWWKWFPERVRVNAPEWILDGDMVITARPDWFEDWKAGRDQVRVSQEETTDETSYGEYSSQINHQLKLYSGLISLPPKATYMKQVADLLKAKPLQRFHNGRINRSEQGVMVTALQHLDPLPIPLHEFPFAFPGATEFDFGKSKIRDRVWGYHFARSFVVRNEHFHELVDRGDIYSEVNPTPINKYRWLSGGSGQWGIPGWGMKNTLLDVFRENAKVYAPGTALELGTSRGRMAAVLADAGLSVTTVDHQDRGAGLNLKDLDVKVVIDEALNFLINTTQSYDVICIDLHENSIETWKKLWRYLPERLNIGGAIIINNLYLAELEIWHHEKGVAHLVENLDSSWISEVLSLDSPAVVKLTRK